MTTYKDAGAYRRSYAAYSDSYENKLQLRWHFNKATQ